MSNCKFKLINKTLVLYKKNQVKNNVIPNLNNEEEKIILLKDKIKISNHLKMEMTRKITTIQNINRNAENLDNTRNMNDFASQKNINNNSQNNRNWNGNQNNLGNQQMMFNNNPNVGNWNGNQNNFSNQQMMFNNNPNVGNWNDNQNNFDNQQMIFFNNENVGNWNVNQNMNNFCNQQMIFNNNPNVGNWNGNQNMNNFVNQQILFTNNANGGNFNDNQNMNNFCNLQMISNNNQNIGNWNSNQNMNNFVSQQMMLPNNPNFGDMNDKQNIMINKITTNQKKYLEQTKQQEIKFQHKTGLMNIGQTCYMNASIQSLSNIIELSKSLLKKFLYLKIDIDEQPLTAAFSSLLYELFYPNNNEKYIAPKIFKEIIGELNPLFKGMHAADAKDLIFFIIEKLHKELNPNKLDLQKTPQIDYEQQEKNSTNERLMLQLFFKDFQVKNKTIISDLFYGITRSTMNCQSCGTTKYSFQTFNLLIFQLKKVKETKLKELGKYYTKLNIFDAFNVEKRVEVLKGENMIYCNECNCLREGRHQQKIYSLPKIVIIVLNRGKNNQDFNEEFEFYLDLNLTGQDIIINQQSYHKYYLCGVITHLGESSSSGHFIAYCRDGPKSEFFCYNDASVSPANKEDVIKTKISNKDYEKKTPYILFYHYLE